MTEKINWLIILLILVIFGLFIFYSNQICKRIDNNYGISYPNNGVSYNGVIYPNNGVSYNGVSYSNNGISYNGVSYSNNGISYNGIIYNDLDYYNDIHRTRDRRRYRRSAKVYLGNCPFNECPYNMNSFLDNYINNSFASDSIYELGKINKKSNYLPDENVKSNISSSLIYADDPYTDPPISTPTYETPPTFPRTRFSQKIARNS